MSSSWFPDSLSSIFYFFFVTKIAKLPYQLRRPASFSYNNFKLIRKIRELTDIGVQLSTTQ